MWLIPNKYVEPLLAGVINSDYITIVTKLIVCKLLQTLRLELNGRMVYFKFTSQISQLHHFLQWT